MDLEDSDVGDAVDDAVGFAPPGPLVSDDGPVAFGGEDNVVLQDDRDVRDLQSEEVEEQLLQPDLDDGGAEAFGAHVGGVEKLEGSVESDEEAGTREEFPEELASPKATRSVLGVLNFLLRRFRVWVVALVLLVLTAVIIILAVIWVKHDNESNGGGFTYNIKFKFEVQNGGGTIFNASKSEWLYNYNTALFPLWRAGKRLDALAVRVQNLSDTAGSIYDVGPSLIALSTSEDGVDFTPVSPAEVLISPEDFPWENRGAEDARVRYVEDTHTYYMYYTAVTNKTDAHLRPSVLGNVTAMLCLAVSTDPDARVWEQRGPILPARDWTKSGALLPRDKPPHYLFWGDKDIYVATTVDFLNYTDTPQKLVTRRSNAFDSELVESGPPPLPLSDGNYLFLYNSARVGDYPNRRPHWHLQYNLGAVVLSKDDPTHVIWRSPDPILSPELPWQKCAIDPEPLGLMPNVIFVEGWRATENKDEFLVFLQGCDSFIGTYLLKVKL